MVVRLMSHGDLLLPDSPPELTVHEADPRKGGRRLVPEYPAHVMEESGCVGQERRAPGIVHVVQKILSVLIPLFCRHGEPADGGVLVLGDISSQKVQLAEGVLRELV